MISLPWIPLGLIGILSWSVWLIRRQLSHHGYTEVVNDFFKRMLTSMPGISEYLADVAKRAS